MWYIANESESWTTGADAYSAPLFDLTRSLDPGKRPVTAVLMQSSEVAGDLVAPLSDVVCLNRYYGWYAFGGDLETAKVFLEKELREWAALYPDKPILITEYGADTVSGLHDTGDVMFTEEYQRRYYEANHEVFDRIPAVAGEQAWNFADFATSQNVLRVQGNKKGLFTRDRQPKQAAFALKERWESIPDQEEQ
jgi:beta-glucuronidase